MKRVKVANGNKRWTEKEELMLEENWGKMDLQRLANELGRSKRSVEHRAVALGLGGLLKAKGDWLANDVATALGVAPSTVTRWIKRYDFPVKVRKLKVDRRYLINLEKLMKWLEENQDKWDTNHMEYLALGQEPEWLKIKREKDKKKKNNRKFYTASEDNIILNLYKKDYTFEEIAAETGRSVNAVKHRMKKIRSERKNIPYKNAKTHSTSKAN